MSWNYRVLLPDPALKKLARRADLNTVQALKNDLKWDYAQRYGEEVLQILKPIDEAYLREKHEEREQKAAKRKQQSDEKLAAREEERRQKKLAETQRKRERSCQQSSQYGTLLFTVQPQPPPSNLASSSASTSAGPSSASFSALNPVGSSTSVLSVADLQVSGTSASGLPEAASASPALSRLGVYSLSQHHDPRYSPQFAAQYNQQYDPAAHHYLQQQ